MTTRLLTYDTGRKRLWIAGQRCHHGATGAVLAAGASVAAAAVHFNRRVPLALAATGSLLMAHDWADRSLWFARGWQDQP